MSNAAAFAPVTGLVGTRISDIDGAVIGQVTELLIDSASGRIAYVQIRLDAVSSRQKEQLVVPWSSIRTADQQTGVWQLPVGKTALTSLVETQLL